MKVAIVYPSFYGVGGIARYLDSFLKNLPHGVEGVVVITGSEKRAVNDIPGVEFIHIPTSERRFGLIFWAVKVRFLIKSMYKRGDIDAVNFHLPPLIPGLLLPRNIPLILTVHTTYLGMSGRFSELQRFKSDWNPLSVKIKTWMEQYIFSISKSAIVLTEQGCQEMKNYSYQKPISVVPNGVDVNHFSPNGTVDKDIDVIFCGRLEKRKGSRKIPELCELLVKAQPDIKIAIIGYGVDERFVRMGISKLGENVDFVGKVKPELMVNYYNRSRIYVSTSFYEGLPGTCLESMSMALPVVVWDLLFYRNLVVDGENGYLAEVNDIEGMAGKVLSLVADKKMSEIMGKTARQNVLKEYVWKDLSKKILDTFAERDVL